MKALNLVKGDVFTLPAAACSLEAGFEGIVTSGVYVYDERDDDDIVAIELIDVVSADDGKTYHIYPTTEIDRINSCLSNRLNQYYSLDGIESLCLSLGVDYEAIGGSTKPQKVTSLIDHMTKHNRLVELYLATKAERV